MLKKSLLSIVLSLGLTVSLGANDKLKAEMGQLAGSLSAVQMGFFTNDKKTTLDSVLTLRKEVENFLGNKETIEGLLPENVKHKASIAINSAEMIKKYSDEIIAVLNDRNMRMINKQMKTQKAFTGIQNQCFRCHNLVRDWQ